MTDRSSPPVALLIGRRRRVILRNVLGTIAPASAFALACLGSAPAFAQLKASNDYYKSAGTELLRSVETYHVGPAADKLRIRQYESASGDIAFTLRYFPNHPQGLLQMMQLCEQWKFSAQCNFAMVSDVFANAIAINPNVAAPYVAQGIYLYREKRLQAAIASFEEALTVDANSLNAHYNLGLAYFDTKQFELANVHAQRAYQLGAPVPGLRDKLTRVGQWKPIDTTMPDAASFSTPDSQVTPPSR